MVDSVSNSTVTAVANSVAEEQEPEEAESPKRGLLELTILKAELTGDTLPEFTQSFVSVVYGD